MVKVNKGFQMEIFIKDSIKITDLMVLEHIIGNKEKQLMKEVSKMD